MAPPKLNLIKLTKPVLKSEKKLKAFVWKRIILDREKECQVAKKDLKALDPAWKGKTVVWKFVEEYKEISMIMVETLFEDKSKPQVVKAVDPTANVKKIKTFFDSTKSQNLFMVLSRLPKVEQFLLAVDNLNN